MCGIFGVLGTKTTALTGVRKGLVALEYRGYDSWGTVVAQDDGTLLVRKDVGMLSQTDTSLFSTKGTRALGHTRWATHGGVTPSNAHPHVDCGNRFALVHNGIVENNALLKDRLSATHRFTSQTDTEVVVHYLEEMARQTANVLEAWRRVVLNLAGFNALAVLDKEDESLLFYRQGSPLVIGRTLESYVLSSDSNAFDKTVTSIWQLPEGVYGRLRPDLAQVYSARNGQKVNNSWQAYSVPLKYRQHTYAHDMLSEIHDQVQLLPHLLTYDVPHGEEGLALIKKAQRIYVTGCGSAGLAATIGAEWLAKTRAATVMPIIGSEFLGLTDRLHREDLLVALSQSGETMDTLEAARIAQGKGMKVLALVNTLTSSLDRLADVTIPLDAGLERAVASTKTFTAKLVRLYQLAYGYGADIGGFASFITPTLRRQIRRLAKVLSKQEHVFVIGRGIGLPSAQEAAMKIKEVSYVHAEGLSGGELKHGPIALVEQGTVVIVLVRSDEYQTSQLSAAAELKARGARVIGLSPTSSPLFDDWVETLEGELLSPLTWTIAGQLLAYDTAVIKGLNPDRPRNLAKSVTVK